GAGRRVGRVFEAHPTPTHRGISSPQIVKARSEKSTPRAGMRNNRRSVTRIRAVKIARLCHSRSRPGSHAQAKPQPQPRTMPTAQSPVTVYNARPKNKIKRIDETSGSAGSPSGQMIRNKSQKKDAK